jgi:hypothetical protein
VGADHHDLAGIAGAGLGDDVALRPAGAIAVLLGRLKGWGAGLEARVAQHADHIFDAGVVAGGPSAPVAAVLVGDLLQCLKVLHCLGIAYLARQSLHQWPSRRGGVGARRRLRRGGRGARRRLRCGGRRLHCSRTAGRGGEKDRDRHEGKPDTRPCQPQGRNQHEHLRSVACLIPAITRACAPIRPNGHGLAGIVPTPSRGETADVDASTCPRNEGTGLVRGARRSES